MGWYRGPSGRGPLSTPVVPSLGGLFVHVQLRSEE